MDPLGIAVAAGGSLLSPVIDLFTGASRKRRQAQDAQEAALARMLGDINTEIGPSTTESLGYKASKGQFDSLFKRRARANEQRANAAGMTPEAQMGQMEGLNDSYNQAILGALGTADRRRQMLREQARQLTLQKYGLDVARAQGTLDRQNQFAGSIASILPFLFRDVPEDELQKKGAPTQ
jgi:hypothetical protein